MDKKRNKEVSKYEINISIKTKLKSFFSRNYNDRFNKLKVKYKKDPKKLVVSAMAILGLFLCLIGSSYAYLAYVSKTDNTTTISAGTLALVFKNEENAIVMDDAVPVSDNYALENFSEYSFDITNTGNINAKYVITLDNICDTIKEYTIDGVSFTPDVCIPDRYIKVGVKEGDGKYNILNYNNEVEGFLEGNQISDDKYVLVSSTLAAGETKSYKMKVWLDYHTPNTYNAKDGQNIVYSGKLSLIYEQGAKTLDTSGANAPVLKEGMIPVYYDNASAVWRKADESNNQIAYKWYDYNNKTWANAVTVSATSEATGLKGISGNEPCADVTCTRTDYIDAPLGTEIPMEDILTMQVWIPRYKYTVWNYNADGTVTSEPRRIEIMFEKGTVSTGEISCEDQIMPTANNTSEICKLKATNATCTDALCNDRTYTHPAFTLGDRELEGFWMGKFETSGTLDALTVKPNVYSLVNESISDYETNISAMSNEGNKYGLPTDLEVHVIKNIEWGAVAYFGHSNYGFNGNIGINNNAKYLTGCGNVADSVIVSKCNAYNTTLGMNASTTGNIYGVYDMSGSASEYTLANVMSSNGTTMLSGANSTENSGYTGMVNDTESFTGIAYPLDIFLDKYSYSTNGAERQRSKLGDAVKEVYKGDKYGWYDDYSALANNTNPWVVRSGAACLEGTCAGIFYTDAYYGNGNEDIASRLTMK